MIEAQAYKYIVVIDSTASRSGCSVLVSDVPFVTTFSDDNFYRYYTASDGNDFLFPILAILSMLLIKLHLLMIRRLLSLYFVIMSAQVSVLLNLL